MTHELLEGFVLHTPHQAQGSPWSQEGSRPGRNTAFVPVELEGGDREVPELALQVRAGWGAQGALAHKCSVPAGLGVWEQEQLQPLQ